MTRDPQESELREFAGPAESSRYFLLWGLLAGGMVGILVGHPLFMIAFNLHEYLDHQASLALGKAILHSFSFHAWPLTLLFALSSAVFGAILGGLYQRLERNRLAYEARLRSLAAEISLIEARERQRLATELHEHIGQVLAFAQIKLGLMSEEATPGLLPMLREVREHIDHSIKYTRSLTFELSPPVLYELGFEAALEWLAKQIRDSTGIKVEVQRENFPLQLPEEARILLFSVVRELLTNVVKHAQASQVKIFLGQEGGNLRVQVDDDGVGFELAPSGAAGFGLFSIRERLARIGGSLEVKSQVGRGTSVGVTVPLAPDEPVANRPARGPIAP
jgi:signal transduction histidine kinase